MSPTDFFSGATLTKFFAPARDERKDPPPVDLSKEREDKAAADEGEDEARRRRRGALRRVFTSPGSNFVSSSNIGKNTLTGS